MPTHPESRTERARPRSELSKRLRDKGYLLCTEAAKKVGVNRATIYRWIRENSIDALDINGAYYVSWDSIVVHLGKAATVLGYVNTGTASEVVRHG